MSYSRNLLFIVAIATIIAPSLASPNRKLVFFQHNSIPSNLYVNAAHGPALIKDDPDGKTEIIRLLLYPADKKSRAPKAARAAINTGSIYGLVTLRQDMPPTGSTFVAGVMKGLDPGTYGIKVFEFGDIEANCEAVGRVYNPYNVESTPLGEKRHIGNLGTIVANENGTAEFGMSDSFVSLVGPRSVIGRAIVVTSDDSQSENSIVKKHGCGVIGYAR